MDCGDRVLVRAEEAPVRPRGGMDGARHAHRVRPDLARRDARTERDGRDHVLDRGIRYVSLVGIPSRETRLNARVWVAVIGLLVVYAAGASDAAVRRLRVPIRAQRAGWPYSYGFSQSPIRWLGRAISLGRPSRGDRSRRASQVAGAERVGQSGHPGARPVDVKVWQDRELVLRSRLRTAVPVTQYVRVPPDEKRVLIETWASPAWFGPATSARRTVASLASW